MFSSRTLGGIFWHFNTLEKKTCIYSTNKTRRRYNRERIIFPLVGFVLC